MSRARLLDARFGALRTNMLLNPHAATITGWSSTNNGGTSTSAVVATGAPDGGSFYRMTITAVSATAAPYVRWGSSGASSPAPVPNQPFTSSIWFRSSAAGQYKMTVLGHLADGSGWVVAGAGAIVTLAANTWTRISHTVPVWPATAAYARSTALVEPVGADNFSRWQVGSTLDGTMALSEASATMRKYFDGATPNARWLGAAAASASLAFPFVGGV